MKYFLLQPKLWLPFFFFTMTLKCSKPLLRVKVLLGACCGLAEGTSVVGTSGSKEVRGKEKKREAGCDACCSIRI